MWYLIVYLILVLSYSSACGIDYLIPDSDTKIITQEELAGKSNSFIRYARNEIFARKGYRFDDSDLSLFFQHQDWYHPSGSNEINLTSVEKENVDLLVNVEEALGDDIAEIIYSSKLDSSTIFYIGNNFDYLHSSGRWRSGELVYLDKEYSWTSDCKSIPPEYLFEVADTSIRIRDHTYALRKKQISIIDIDEGYANNLGKEVLVSLAGPSDDPERVFFGLNNDREFVELFRIPADRYKQLKINDRKILFEARVRMNLHGTSWHNQEYLFDTVTKEFYTVPIVFISLGYPHQVSCKKAMQVYYDAGSAALRNQSGVIGEIKEGTSFEIVKFYRVEKEGSAQIRFDMDGQEIDAWIPQKELNFWNVDGLNFVD